MILSTGGGGCLLQGVPGPGGAWSWGVPGGDPLGRPLLWAVCILLECILVSVVSGHQSVILSTWARGGMGSYVTITHDALHLNIQGPSRPLPPPPTFTK